MPPKRGKKGSQAENSQKEPIAKEPRLSRSSKTAESKEKKKQDVMPTTRRTRSTKPGSTPNSESLPSAPLSPEIRVVRRAETPTPEPQVLTAEGHSHQCRQGRSSRRGRGLSRRSSRNRHFLRQQLQLQPCREGRGTRRTPRRKQRFLRYPLQSSRCREGHGSRRTPRRKRRLFGAINIDSRCSSKADGDIEEPSSSETTGYEWRHQRQQPLQPTEYESYVDGRAFASSTKNPVSGITSESASNSGDQFTRFMSVFTTTLEAFRDTTLNAESSHMRNKLLPAKKLPEFTGNPYEWINFKKTYDWTSKVGNFTDSENVIRLKEAIKGEARDAVSTLFATGQDAAYIIETLELYYGRKEVIAKFLVKLKIFLI